jgi:uncharacterized repeat protein (TIGR01451 family)
MKRLLTKTIIVVVVVTLLWPHSVFAKNLSPTSEEIGSHLASVETTPVVQESPSTEPGVKVIESTKQGVVLELVTPDFSVQKGLAENDECDQLTVADYGETVKAGWPRLPVIGTMVGVPQHADPVLSILAADATTLPDAYNLCPVPQPIYDVDPEGQITYQGEAAIPDATAYATDSFYPTEIAAIVETGMLRSQRVAQLRFQPFQYNPVTGIIKYYHRIRVQVLFGDEGAFPAGVSARDSSPGGADAFDSLLAQIVVNDTEARQWREPSAARAVVSRKFNALTTSQPEYKLTVNEDGLYQVTYAELAAAGIPVATLDPRTFTLHTQGTEVALYVPGESDGIFDPEDVIIFYGEKTNTKFTDTNAYWLTWGEADGLRMAEIDGTPSGEGSVPEYFRTTQRLEQNKTYQSLYPSGTDEDRWYWSFLLASAPTTAQFTTTLNTPVSSSVSATVRGLFKGYAAAPQHHTRVYLNGYLIVDALWASKAEYFFSVNVPASILASGTNTITIQVPMDQGITLDFTFVNWFEIDYDRAYTANGDSLQFDVAAAGTWEYSVTGFTTATVQTFDVTTPTAPARVINPIVELENDAYTVRFQQTTEAAHRYVAATPQQFRSVLSIVAHQPTDLHNVNNGADYIIITHSDFYTDVQPLADYRAAQGLRTLVVDVQDVYDEFSGGVFDPNAIRDFLAYAYANWTSPAPAYVLLMGDGNYDFKDYTGRGELNYIPPFLANVDPWMGEVAADNRYVCVNGTDVFPDMYLGRLPVKTSTEAQAVVTKILDYEQNPATGDWNQKVLFATDNPDSAGDFYAYSDTIADNYLPAPYVGDKVYYGRTHTSSSAARSAILGAINEGRLIVNYVGHGAANYWASEQLLKRTDANTFTNMGRLPFFVPMACLDGYYIHPSTSSSDLSSTAEALVRAPGKGAIAVWSSTGMGTATAHDYLNKGLFKAIFADDIIQLGPATLQGKLYLYSRTSWYNDQIDTYLLFGDPALRLNVVPADVSLTQAIAAPDVLSPGSNVTYTLAFTNTGLATAHHVVVDNVLSSSLVDPEIVSTGSVVVTRTGSFLTWDVADLATGESGIITITATISEAFSGVLVNPVSIATSAVDIDTANNAPDPMATAVYVPPEAVTAVQLISFIAKPTVDSVLLTWETATELDTVGFNLYRATSVDAPKSQLNDHLIPAQSLGDVLGAVYAFVDETADPAATYIYWLEDISFDGIETIHEPVTATTDTWSIVQHPTFLPLRMRTP